MGSLSTSQVVAALVPGARIVKALNNMIASNLEADPVVNGARRVAFISADDDGAKKRVGILLKELGYSVIDLGNLRDGGLIQQAVVLLQVEIFWNEQLILNESHSSHGLW